MRTLTGACADPETFFGRQKVVLVPPATPISELLTIPRGWVVEEPGLPLLALPVPSRKAAALQKGPKASLEDATTAREGGGRRGGDAASPPKAHRFVGWGWQSKSKGEEARETV